MIDKSATLYRMSTDKHLCPFGLKSRDLLKRKGYALNDHLLTTREETEAFKDKHGVDTTPQTFIEGKRIGGYTDLLKFFGESIPDKNEATYAPVIAVFAMTLLMAMALSYGLTRGVNIVWVLGTFIALTMCVLAVQKLRDLRAFSMQFITYDLLAMQFTRYAYVYAFLEAFAGIGMLANLSPWLVSPPALFIGTIGAVSIIKAVYIDKRELKCACVGGDSKVPLGFVSLTENMMMIIMAIWMFVR